MEIIISIDSESNISNCTPCTTINYNENTDTDDAPQKEKLDELTRLKLQTAQIVSNYLLDNGTLGPHLSSNNLDHFIARCSTITDILYEFYINYIHYGTTSLLELSQVLDAIH